MDRKVIGIYGVPRTGTSWLGELFNSNSEVIYKYQPQFAYKYRGRIGEDSTYEEIKSCFDEICLSEDYFVNQIRERNSGKLPKFGEKEIKESSILVYKEARFIYTIENIIQKYPQFKLIAIIRNPIDTLNSWINAPKEFDEAWDINREWKEAKLKNNGLRENFYGYDKWKEAIGIFQDLYLKYSGRVQIIKYEDLCSNPKYEIKKLFEYGGLKYTSDTCDFIESSQKYSNDDPYSVYRDKNLRGKKYKNILSKDIVEAIRCDLHRNKEIKRFGY